MQRVVVAAAATVAECKASLLEAPMLARVRLVTGAEDVSPAAMLSCPPSAGSKSCGWMALVCLVHLHGL